MRPERVELMGLDSSPSSSLARLQGTNFTASLEPLSRRALATAAASDVAANLDEVCDGGDVRLLPFPEAASWLRMAMALNLPWPQIPLVYPWESFVVPETSLPRPEDACAAAASDTAADEPPSWPLTAGGDA